MFLKQKPKGTISISEVPPASVVATVTEARLQSSPVPSTIVDWSNVQNKPTFGTASLLNVNTSGNATDNQVVKGNDSRLDDARAPLDHTHPVGQINDLTPWGRAFVQLADAPAARSVLGLGNVATDSVVPIVRGGTGQITAPLARGALGSGATGDALFLSATAAAARGTLGAGATGEALFQSATSAAARTALNPGTTGEQLFLAGTPAAARTILSVAPTPVFQCRLEFVSTSILRLTRRFGSYIFINGQFYQIPAAGVDLAPTGLTATTTYNIFAFWNGSAIQLEASTTGRATDTTYGHPIKAGDPTRTVVGKAFCQTGVVWDVNNPLLTISYWNRVRRKVSQDTSGNTNISSTSPGSVLGAAFFLSWGEDASDHFSQGAFTSANNGVVCFLRTSILNSVNALIDASVGLYWQAYANGAYGALSASRSVTVGEHLGLGSSGFAYALTSLDSWNNTGLVTTLLSGAQVQTVISG